MSIYDHFYKKTQFLVSYLRKIVLKILDAPLTNNKGDLIYKYLLRLVE